MVSSSMSWYREYRKTCLHVEDFEQFLTNEQHVSWWEGHKKPLASCRGLHPLLSTREAQHLHFSYPFWTRVELGLNRKTEIYDKNEISRKPKISRENMCMKQNVFLLLLFFLRVSFVGCFNYLTFWYFY